MMKKLLLGITLMAGLTANAQLADGTVAPDWTLTDIDGNTHTLSSYTSQGKTVIIDFSATWCGPCWAYHDSHVLADLYNAYGPNGSDEIMVFFIEGDASTTSADLQGTGGNTMGNWIEGTPYPIIDNDTLNTAYNITYWPTIYRICPDGLIYEEGRSDVAEWIAAIDTACSQPLNGTSNHGEIMETEVILCEAGITDFTTDIKNYGANDITAANAILKENGTQVSSASYSGSPIPTFQSGSISFSGVTINAGSTYEIELTDINGGAINTNTPADFTVADLNYNLAGSTDQWVTVVVHTDNYSDEVYMEITDASGTVVWWEGNENVAGNYNLGTFPPPADPTNPLEDDIEYTWTVGLSSVECYTFHMYDYYGDGLSVGGTVTLPGYDVKDNTGAILFSETSLDYGGYEFNKVVNNTANVSLPELEGLNVLVYPNPATDMINVELAEDATVSLLDLQGRILNSEFGKNVSFSVDNFAAGSYLITVSSDDVLYTEKVQIK